MDKSRLFIALALCSFSAYGEIIDQQQTQLTHVISANAFAPVGQSFIPELTQLTQITLQLSDAGGFGVGNHVHLNIRKQSIHGEIIAQSGSQFLEDCFNFEQGPGCNVGGGTPVAISFDFSDSVNLEIGNTYVFEVATEGSGDGLLVAYSNSDNYLNGQMIKSGSEQQGDLQFTTYGIGELQIIASAEQRFLQFDKDGSLLASHLIPESASLARTRDLIFHPQFGVHFYNGVFTPELTQWYDEVWLSQTFAGWSTVNNISYGGLAQFNQWLFATDMQTSQGGEANGLVRFDATLTEPPVRFQSGDNYMDITLGLDQKLYALKSGGGSVDIFDPVTLALTQSIDIGNRTDYRAVSANADGEIWYVTWSGILGHYALSAEQTLNLSSNLMDIDLHPQFGVLVSGRFGEIWHISDTMEINAAFNAGFNNAFVAFAETKPQPTPKPPEALQYCDASGTNTRYEWIDQIALDGNTYISEHDNGYFLHPEPAILHSGANAITLVPGFSWGNYNEHWRIWLDSNVDGEFSDNELFLDSTSANTINTSIMLPLVASTVNTRLRIAMKYGSASNACGSFYFGEVEDIAVTLQP